MKQFLKITLASVLGTLIALFLAVIGFFFFVMIMVSALSADETVTISNKTILEVRLDYTVPERTLYRPDRNLGFLLPGFEKELGMNDITKNIQKAKSDENITGIYLNLNNF